MLELTVTVTLKNVDTGKTATITLPATEREIHLFYSDDLDINACGDEAIITEWHSEVEGLCEYLEVDEESSLFDISDDLERLDMDVNGDALEAAMEYFGDFVVAEDKIVNNGYSVYEDCHSMTDVAYEAVKEIGWLNNIPEEVAQYFNYEAYGRDLEYEGQYVYHNGNYYEFF